MILKMYQDCPHCGMQPVLLRRERAEQILRKKISYDRILLCPKGCRYTVVEKWNG